MNSKTHKIVTAIYHPPIQHFVVPIDWDIKDINVKWDNIYYKSFIKKEIPSYTEDDYEDENIPQTIEEGDWKEVVNYFSCCESEEEDSSSEEEDSSSEEEETKEQEPKKYELQDDCWNIVKEFAGIYNLTTKWNKLENLGIEKIHDTLKQHGRTRLTNYKSNALESKKIIYKLLLTKYKSFKLMTDLNDLLNPKKEDNSFDDYKVGDEVIYYSGRGWCGSSRLGKIIKINKSSITWAEFEVSHKVSDNPNAVQFQQFEEVKHYYDKTKTMKPKCIKSNISKPKPYEVDYYEERHDWGR